MVKLGVQLKKMLPSFWLMRPKKGAQNQRLALLPGVPLLLEGRWAMQVLSFLAAKAVQMKRLTHLKPLVFAYHHLPHNLALLWWIY